jgi:hypothetical protein
MSFAAWRRVPEAGACDFCLMLATRGAVYRTAQTAGDGNDYHRHCRCDAALETDFNAREDVYIDPADANRKIAFRNQKTKRTYRYDLSKYKLRNPPEVPAQAPVTAKRGADVVDDVIEYVDDLPRTGEETLAEAITKTNPLYDTGAAEWRNNCTRCVVAAEMRARGYQVVAGARSTGDYSHRILNEVFDNIYLRRFNSPSGGRLATVLREIAEDFDGKIDKSITARLWIRWSWKGQKSGHIVMGEIRKGKLTIYDPQTGKVHAAKDFAGQITDVQYARVDDLPLSESGALDYVSGA